MARTPTDRTHFLPPTVAGDVYSYSWDHAPVPVVVAAEDEGASAITSYAREGVRGGPHCLRAGLSRAAVHIVRLDQADSVAAIPTVPPRVWVSLWTITGDVSSPVVTAQWSPSAWSAGGLLIQVSGILCEGFELRWRVDDTSPAPAVVRQLRAHLRWVVDRESAGFEILTGPHVGNITTPLTKV